MVVTQRQGWDDLTYIASATPFVTGGREIVNSWEVPMSEPKYLTAADVAWILHVTPGAVRMMHKRGVLTAAEQTVGGIHLFLREEVDRLALLREKPRMRIDHEKPRKERASARRAGGGR